MFVVLTRGPLNAGLHPAPELFPPNSGIVVPGPERILFVCTAAKENRCFVGLRRAYPAQWSKEGGQVDLLFFVGACSEMNHMFELSYLRIQANNLGIQSLPPRTRTARRRPDF